MTLMKTHALHGFLGLTSDWDPFDFPITSHPVLDNPPSPTNGLQEWAIRFNRDVGTTLPKLLMGYSLGGRLAMHAITQNPEYWSGAILISCHPGLSCHIKREERLKKDIIWAEKFEKEPWHNLMTQWNAQEPFKFSKPCVRNEEDYSREQLSAMLRYWSVGNQENLTAKLQTLSIPILWIAGKQDFTYASLAESLSFAHPKSKRWIADGAGHRVPWESNEFSKVVKEFISHSLQD